MIVVVKCPRPFVADKIRRHLNNPNPLIKRVPHLHGAQSNLGHLAATSLRLLSRCCLKHALERLGPVTATSQSPPPNQLHGYDSG